MSFKVVVKVSGESKLSGNGLRFATENEANEYGSDLMSRWFAVELFQVQPSDDHVSHTFLNGKLKSIE